MKVIPKLRKEERRKILETKVNLLTERNQEIVKSEKGRLIILEMI